VGRDAVPWAMHFPNPTTPEGRYTLVPLDHTYDVEKDADVWIHPTQLYEFLANLCIFGILLWVDRRCTKGAFRGRLVALYLVLYSIGRGAIEHWRGDADRGEYFGGAVSFSQIVSVFVLLGGVMMYRGLKKREHRAAA
jgi:prolipoprotein diacylglyceryltransferase